MYTSWLLHQVPAIGLVLSTGIYLYAVTSRDYRLYRVALIAFSLAVIFALAMVLTTSVLTDRILDKEPEILHDVIEENENLTELSMIGTIVAGVIAIAYLNAYRTSIIHPRWHVGLIVTLSLIAIVMLVWVSNHSNRSYYTHFLSIEINQTVSRLAEPFHNVSWNDVYNGLCRKIIDQV